MNKKTEAALKAIGIYVGINAFVVVAAYIARFVFYSSIGHWLELDRPTKPGASLLALQIFPLMVAIYYYRDQTKRQ